MFMRGIDLFSLLPLLALAVLCDAFSPPTILMIKGGCIRPQGRAWTRGSGGRVAESISMQDGEEKGAKDFSAGKGKGGITRRDAVLGFGLSFVPAVSSTEKYQRISTKRIPLATAQCHHTRSLACFGVSTSINVLFAAIMISHTFQTKFDQTIHQLIASAIAGQDAPAPLDTSVRVAVEEKPSKELLALRGIEKWSDWSSSDVSFDYTYEKAESIYVLEGEATVKPTGGSAGKAVTLVPGMFVTFPKGYQVASQDSCSMHTHLAIAAIYSAHASRQCNTTLAPHAATAMHIPQGILPVHAIPHTVNPSTCLDSGRSCFQCHWDVTKPVKKKYKEYDAILSFD